MRADSGHAAQESSPESSLSRGGTLFTTSQPGWRAFETASWRARRSLRPCEPVAKRHPVEFDGAEELAIAWWPRTSVTAAEDALRLRPHWGAGTRRSGEDCEYRRL